MLVGWFAEWQSKCILYSWRRVAKVLPKDCLMRFLRDVNASTERWWIIGSLFVESRSNLALVMRKHNPTEFELVQKKTLITSTQIICTIASLAFLSCSFDASSIILVRQSFEEYSSLFGNLICLHDRPKSHGIPMDQIDKSTGRIML